MVTQWPKFRLTLDRPYDFAVEPGMVRAVHCHDFRDDELSLKDGAFRCPVTGLVFLTPSWLNEDYGVQFEPIASWTKGHTGAWSESKRMHDQYSVAEGSGILNAPMLSSQYPASTGGVINWMRDVTILGSIALLSRASKMLGDELQWALESTFTLNEDEGFVLHLNQVTDPVRRHKNGFAIHWDNLQMHIRPDGVMALYRYADRADMSSTTTLRLVEEYAFSSPGELAAKDGYILFLPIPTMGLLVYHDSNPQRLSAKLSSARAGSVRGHLFDLPSEQRDGEGESGFRLTQSSSVGIALGKSTRVARVIGFHRLRFPSGGSYLDAIYSPVYRPSNPPSQVEPITLATGRGYTVAPSAAFRKIDDTGDWIATDKQGRVKAILVPDPGNIYTPFLLGTYLRWEPVRTARTTKPLRLTPDGGRYNDGGTGQKDTIDFLQRLEFTETDEARFEGKASLYVRSDEGKHILERGDCTWDIERQDEAGGEWSVVCGGIARWEDHDVQVNTYDAGDDDAIPFGLSTRRRVAYLAQISLYDGWHRFTEVHQCNETAFDRLTIHQAIDTVLLASGEPALSGTIPPILDDTTLPAVPKGENWRHGTQEGDEGGAILRQLLLYVRKQWTQYRLVNDWFASTWSIRESKRLTGSDDPHWWMTPDQREALGLVDPAGAPDTAHRIEIGTGEGTLFSFKAYPPEANLIRPFGLEKPGADAKRVPGTPLINQASLSDDTSIDYLGRAVVANPMLAPLTEEETIARFGRMIYDGIAHRRLVISVPATGYLKDFHPGEKVTLRSFDASGSVVTKFDSWWMRRKTTILDYLNKGDVIASIYTLDEQWDTPLD